MLKDYLIRDIQTPEYRERFINLHKKTFEKKYSQHKYNEKKDNVALFFKVISHDINAIGYLIWTCNRKKIIIMEFWIDAEFRSLMISTYLFNKWYLQINKECHHMIWVGNINKDMLSLINKIGYSILEDGQLISHKDTLMKPPLFLV